MNEFLAIASSGVWTVVELAILVLTIAAYWKIFEKAGEKGWKAIIPVYSNYVLYKLVWKKSMFWWNLVLGVIAGIAGVVFIGALIAAGGGADAMMMGGTALISMLVFLATGIVSVVINIILYVKMARAYGYGGGFAVGLIFINTVFILILGLGNAEYIGPQNN